MRTQQEILERVRTVRTAFGFAQQVLIPHLDFEHAKEFLVPEVTAQEWDESRRADADVASAATDYLEFAFGKCSDHRGLSASRSVEKMTEYAWLQGRDDVVKAMDEAEYAQYGVPKLVAYAKGFDLHIPDDDPGLLRMAQGVPCEEGCDMGCGE